MAVSLLGTDIVTSSANSGSESTVSIPSGATFALILSGQYAGTAYTAITASLDSQSANTEYLNTAFYGDRCGIHTVTGFSTGTGKTFAHDWSGTNSPAEGAPFFMAFFSGVDTSDPIRDFAVTDGATTSPSFDSGTDDICIGWGLAYDQIPDLSDGGQTEIGTPAIFNVCGYCAATKPGVSGSTTMVRDTAYFGQFAAMSIRASAGGPTISKINGGSISSWSKLDGGSISSWSKFNGGDV